MIYNPRDADFSFMNCGQSILYISKAYEIVTQSDLWEFLYWYNPELQTGELFQYTILRNKIQKSVNTHTEDTLNYTMEVILYIAKKGFFKYKENYNLEQELYIAKSKQQHKIEKLQTILERLEKRSNTEICN